MIPRGPHGHLKDCDVCSDLEADLAKAEVELARLSGILDCATGALCDAGTVPTHDIPGGIRALTEELARMRPVVEAAKAWQSGRLTGRERDKLRALSAALDRLRESEEAP